jgi:hypothetical protein
MTNYSQLRPHDLSDPGPPRDPVGPVRSQRGFVVKPVAPSPEPTPAEPLLEPAFAEPGPSLTDTQLSPLPARPLQRSSQPRRSRGFLTRTVVVVIAAGVLLGLVLSCILPGSGSAVFRHVDRDLARAATGSRQPETKPPEPVAKSDPVAPVSVARSGVPPITIEMPEVPSPSKGHEIEPRLSDAASEPDMSYLEPPTPIFDAVPPVGDALPPAVSASSPDPGNATAQVPQATRRDEKPGTPVARAIPAPEQKPPAPEPETLVRAERELPRPQGFAAFTPIRPSVTTPPGLHKAALGRSPRRVEIIGGPAYLTEFRIANELASVIGPSWGTIPDGRTNAEPALRVTPLVSLGCKDTVRDVLTMPNADFGIVPERVLNNLRESREFGDISDRIGYIVPLYISEIHLLAGPGIQSINDLKNKTVGIGSDEGAHLIVSELLSDLGIPVTPKFLDLHEAVPAIRNGTIAAAFVVSGKPLGELAALPRDSGVRLVPIAPASPPLGFIPRIIVAEDYPNLLKSGESTRTLGVRTVLFSYKWPPASFRAQMQERFILALFGALSDLQKPAYHPKWKHLVLEKN